MKLPNNPYKGPFAFSSGDEDRFFGRAKETNELIKLIQQCQLTVLFGSSGTGKTSLIQAKLLPQLRREYFLPIYIRINFESTDPLEFTKRRILEELRKFDSKLAGFGANETLIGFAAKTDIFGGMVKPVLFFDQFEELFTLGPKNDPYLINNFMLELADLIEVRLPDRLKDIDNYTNLLNFKVVFSLRQDWVAYLEDYHHIIPSILENRFRLKRFSASQALEAIYSPAENFISQSTAKKIIEKIGKPALWESISDDLGDEDKNLINLSIDPFVLSLYCFELFENIKAIGESYITEYSVEENNHHKLIRNYYDKNIVEYPTLKKLIEDKLLNESGKRLTMSVNQFTDNDYTILNEVQRFSTETGILRVIGESPLWEVEIVHDQLGDQIFERRTEEIRRLAKEKEADATRLRSSAKKAKRNTIFAVVGALVALGLFYIFASTKIGGMQQKSEQDSAIAHHYIDSLIDRAEKDNTIPGLKAQLIEKEKYYGKILKELNNLIKAQNASITKLGGDTLKIKQEVSSKLNDEEKKYQDYISKLKQDLAETENDLTKANATITQLRNTPTPTVTPIIQPQLDKDKLTITGNGETLREENDSTFYVSDFKKLGDDDVVLNFSLITDPSFNGRSIEVKLYCPLKKGGIKPIGNYKSSSKRITNTPQQFSFSFSKPTDDNGNDVNFIDGTYKYEVLINKTRYITRTFKLKKG